METTVLLLAVMTVVFLLLMNRLVPDEAIHNMYYRENDQENERIHQRIPLSGETTAPTSIPVGAHIHVAMKVYIGSIP